jgi:hypothetical protein
MPRTPQLAALAVLFTPFWRGPELGGSTFEFSPGVTLGQPPDWIAGLITRQRQFFTSQALEIVEQARFAVVFDLLRMGTRAEEERLGPVFRPPLDALASLELGLWLARPSRASVLMSLHYERFVDGEGRANEEYFDPHVFAGHLRAHETYRDIRPSSSDLAKSATLMAVVRNIGEGTAVANPC